MDRPATIIIVDDDEDIRTLLNDFLSQYNYKINAASNGQDLLALLETGEHFDIIVLDLMLPDKDGITLCQEIRKKSSIPIIMLTAVNTDIERIVSLESGADDYLAKPFNPRELLARIKAILRRFNETSPKAREINSHSQRTVPIYEFAGWTLDVSTRRLTSPDQAEVALSSATYTLLLTFVEHPQRVLTRDQLLDMTKGRMAEPFDRSIDVLISRLRQKIEENPKNPKILKTIQSAGYIFTPAVNKSKIS